MKVTIDRFEEDFAVLELENGERLNAPKALFDFAEEGDRIEIRALKQKAFASDDAPSDSQPQEDTPHALFERLRKKKKQQEEKG